MAPGWVRILHKLARQEAESAVRIGIRAIKRPPRRWPVRLLAGPPGAMQTPGKIRHPKEW